MNTEPPYNEDALEFRFVHASGPGGQHVNKTSTAVELRVSLSNLTLNPGAAERLQNQQRSRINKRGELVIFAEQFRSQLKNRKAAVARLDEMIATASIRPKKRIATRPSNSAKRKRTDQKKQRGQTKSNRRKPNLD